MVNTNLRIVCSKGAKKKFRELILQKKQDIKKNVEFVVCNSLEIVNVALLYVSYMFVYFLCEKGIGRITYPNYSR